jgi:drug/metabolite transporter (DMT)-like permease
MWMLVSAVLFTAMTSLIKFLGKDYPAALQTFYRQAASLVVLAPLIVRNGRSAFATTRPGFLMIRASAVTVAMILTFYAFQKLPLAQANALSFTRALWIVPLAIFVLKEKVGPMRIGAAAVGFLGVLLMVRPGVGGVPAGGLGTLAILAASFLLAFTVTGMKVLTRDHSLTSLMVWSALLGLLFAVPGALFTWRTPAPMDLLLLCLMGVIATASQACYFKGIQLGDAAAMAPIDYTRLIFTTAAGYLLFREIPNAWTIAGAAVVVASTLFITLREQQLARAEKFAT